MGAYTWTFVRIDKLTKQQIKSCVEYALKYNQSNFNRYFNYSKMKEEEYIKDWLDFHHSSYDYFLNECEVDPNKLTDEYLTKQIKNKMKKWFYAQKCYQKCLDGTMTVEEMLRKTHQLRGIGNDFFVIKRKGYYYANIRHEIFRNSEYSDKEYDNVQDLVTHLEDPKLISIMDYSKKETEYKPLTPELKQKIIEYYSAIGDGNFIVRFD